jgi:SAM-dependent methyltransferase
MLMAKVDWGERARQGFLASGIDPADRRGRKNSYIDLLQKTALEDVLQLRGDERVLDFGCGSGRFAYWMAPKVKEVVGLEVTPEMIGLAERNRTAENVKFLVYDGVQFPALPEPVDLILSVGVLQTMNRDTLRRVLSGLVGCLKKEGRLFLIEQASDRPTVGRPSVSAYLQAFAEGGLDVIRHYPIRGGRWWMLYLIRYGVVAPRWYGRAARYELEKRRKENGAIRFYKDFLFLLRKR